MREGECQRARSTVCALAKVAGQAVGLMSRVSLWRGERQGRRRKLAGSTLTHPDAMSFLRRFVKRVIYYLLSLTPLVTATLVQAKPARRLVCATTTDPTSAAARALAIPELLLLTFANLDQHSLTLTARVDRQFGLISQQLLYAEPVLQQASGVMTSSRPVRVKSFWATLNRREDLCAVVKRVDVHVRKYPTAPRDVWAFVQGCLKLCVSSLRHGLPTLVNVEKATFHGQYGHPLGA